MADARGPRRHHFKSLQFAAGMTRVVSKDGAILVMGGKFTYSAEHQMHLDQVYVIDAVNRTIRVSGERLPYGVSEIAAVVADGTVYGFGGTSGWYLHTWVT